MVAREGLLFALANHLSVTEMEMDAENVISIIESRSPLAMESPVIEDIYFLLSQLENVSCKFIPRSGNMAAHYLARFDLSVSFLCVWVNEIPLCISTAVMDDFSIDY
ncbi:hypothetical protein TorRG33x02_060860 [Trema orientale]|uniref:RNase H type-1 domain-containing protein n=1 Tax=Trema orientale TaxID=63057 RepID=A0A2P5FJP6_TREOI|nr:hypothetical protein TorRG33x02_060860 [Trema orientale]